MTTSIENRAKCAVGFFLLSMLVSGCETAREYSVTHKVWSYEEWRVGEGELWKCSLSSTAELKDPEILILPMRHRAECRGFDG